MECDEDADAANASRARPRSPAEIERAQTALSNKQKHLENKARPSPPSSPTNHILKLNDAPPHQRPSNNAPLQIDDNPNPRRNRTQHPPTRCRTTPQAASMRNYDNTDNHLHLKSQFNTRQILSNMMRDLADLVFGSRDALLYFLRIAILICGYIVVRPVIEACFRRFMAPQDPDLRDAREERRKKRRKQKQEHTEKPRQKSLAEELLVDSEDDAEGGADDTTPGNSEWGGMLRKRQKAKFMEVWEEEQARLAEEEELRELEDILED